MERGNEEVMGKILIIYYSRKGENYLNGQIVNLEKGNTLIIVEQLVKLLKADVFEIRPKTEYSKDYLLCTEEAQEEARLNVRPELFEYLSDIDDYEDIIIAGPNWWGSYPMPMYSQLEKLDFLGKRIFPVITHEGSGVANMIIDLEKICVGAEIGEELVIQGNEVRTAEGVISSWIEENFENEM